MKSKLLFFYVALLAIFYFLSSSMGTTSPQTPGFFGGLCDGMILLLNFLFGKVWREVNNGAGYKIGFFIGFLYHVRLIYYLLKKSEE